MNLKEDDQRLGRSSLYLYAFLVAFTLFCSSYSLDSFMSSPVIYSPGSPYSMLTLTVNQIDENFFPFIRSLVSRRMRIPMIN